MHPTDLASPHFSPAFCYAKPKSLAARVILREPNLNVFTNTPTVGSLAFLGSTALSFARDEVGEKSGLGVGTFSTRAVWKSLPGTTGG